MGLVDYSSDSDSSGSSSDKAPDVKRRKVTPAGPSSRPVGPAASTPPTRQRVEPTTTVASNKAKGKAKALPRLPDSFGGVNPRDDPRAHQGRVRARPFVDGDYYVHVYIDLVVSTALRRELARVLDAARQRVPGIDVHSFLDPSPSPTPTPGASASPSPASTPAPAPAPAPTPTPRTLHVSLSHPLPLRRDAASALAVTVAATLRATPHPRAFKLSLSSLAIYHNDSRPRRAFLALRVGAGAPELATLLDKVVEPALRQRGGAYHPDAEFHASFGWCLDGHEEEEEQDAASPFPADMLRQLEDEYGPALLAAQPRGGWDVADVCVKVAKTVTRLPL